jgi:hypothetical protein
VKLPTPQLRGRPIWIQCPAYTLLRVGGSPSRYCGSFLPVASFALPAAAGVRQNPSHLFVVWPLDLQTTSRPGEFSEGEFREVNHLLGRKERCSKGCHQIQDLPLIAQRGTGRPRFRTCQQFAQLSCRAMGLLPKDLADVPSQSLFNVRWKRILEAGLGGAIGDGPKRMKGRVPFLRVATLELLPSIRTMASPGVTESLRCK